MTELQEAAARKIMRWRDRESGCLFFATEELGVVPDPWQVDLFKAFSSDDPKKKRIALCACKGVGKTASIAICILWFMCAWGEPGEHPKGAATSITEDNIDDNLWPEISKWQARSEYLKQTFKWTKSRYFCVRHPETWFFSKRTWAKGGDKQQQANTLAGLHSKYLMFAGDETGDIPDSVMAAADAGLTGTEEGRFQKLLQGGNPTRLDGPLYRAAVTEKDIWYTIFITGDPDNPERSTRQDINWAREQIKRYGIDSPWVLVNVFGRFPESSINTLLSDVDVQRAMDRIVPRDVINNGQKRLGIDVARFGGDMSVIFPRQGLFAFQPVEMSGYRTNEIADRVVASKLKWNSDLEFVDGTGGYGGGVVDNLLTRGFSPIEVQFAGKATDDRYANKRAEMYFRMSEWVKKSGRLPAIDDLKKELTATTYTFQRGKLLLSPKDLIKEKLGHSPDKSDALALTFAQGEEPGRLSLEGMVQRMRQGSCKSEYDPFDRERT